MNTLLWFNNDCRLHDNEALNRAATGTTRLLCVFCIDPRWFKNDHYGTQPLGAFRQQFLNETLSNLSKNLHSAGQTLHITYGDPVATLGSLVEKHNITRVVRSQHSGVYENNQWQRLCEKHPQARFESIDTFTLFKREQLVSLDSFPTSFSKFRKFVEHLSINEPFRQIRKLPPPLLVPVQLDAVNKLNNKENIGLPFKGGEESALAHCEEYFASGAASTYKETRNALMGFDQSCKFSPWLAVGSLSPREVVKQLRAYEQEHGANDSTGWIFFELLWREYFQWYAKHYDESMFSFSGIQHKKPLTSFYPQRFKQWAAGNTSWPLVNACMRELNTTGYMSNRGRQIVASCLINELGLDWRCGAAYFEQQLVDYDVASNWGNWQYIAGVGADPRGGRHFNIEKQTAQYDPDYIYINQWCSETTERLPMDSVDAADWPL